MSSVAVSRRENVHGSAVKSMSFLNLRRSERLKLEAYVIVLLAITVLVFSLTWWLKVLLVCVLAGITWHLLFDSSNATRLWKVLMVATGLGGVAVTAIIVWDFDFGAGLKDVPALISL